MRITLFFYGVENHTVLATVTVRLHVHVDPKIKFIVIANLYYVLSTVTNTAPSDSPAVQN